jgi:hypothetical protein
MAAEKKAEAPPNPALLKFKPLANLADAMSSLGALQVQIGKPIFCFKSWRLWEVKELIIRCDWCGKQCN